MRNVFANTDKTLRKIFYTWWTAMFSSLMMLMIGYLSSPCSPFWNTPHTIFHVTTFYYCVSALCPILHTLYGVLHHLGPACFLLSIWLIFDCIISSVLGLGSFYSQPLMSDLFTEALLCPSPKKMRQMNWLIKQESAAHTTVNTCISDLKAQLWSGSFSTSLTRAEPVWA